MGSKTKAFLRWSVAALLVAGMEAGASTIQIDIDTNSLGLSGQNWDLAFDLIDSNPQPNSASISSFVHHGRGAHRHPDLLGKFRECHGRPVRSAGDRDSG